MQALQQVAGRDRDGGGGVADARGSCWSSGVAVPLPDLTLVPFLLKPKQVKKRR